MNSKIVRSVACAGIFVLGMAVPAMADILYVDKNNSSGIEDGSLENPYNTIGEAINIAANGNTVKVSSGVYPEDITISSKAIKLEGEDPAATTIQGIAQTVTVSGSYGEDLVEITGFTITQGVTAGILLDSSTLHVLIRNNIILGNGVGIKCLPSGMRVNILNNTITQNTSDGIYIYSTVDATIIGNIITLNNDRGIYEHYGAALATYNNVYANVDGNIVGGITTIDNSSTDPQFLPASFFLSSGSPSIDRGSPLPAYNDPDGTRNDQGVYGGPAAANYWPSPAGGPVVTSMTVSPPSVPVGGTITLRATGKIR